VSDSQVGKNISVLHIITGLNCGGAENMLLKLVKNQQSRGYKIVVLSLMDEGDLFESFNELGIRVFSFGFYASSVPKLTSLFKIILMVIKIKPNIIHSWMYHANLVATIASFFVSKRTKLIWGVRQTLYNIQSEKVMTRIVIRLTSILSNIPDSIVYNSYTSKKQHIEIGYNESKSIVIPNGFDVEFYSYNYKTNFQYNSSSFIFANVARFHPMKNHEGLIRTFARVANLYNDTVLVLAGEGLTEENQYITQMINYYSLSERVILLGRIDIGSVKQLMAAIDVFILPSIRGEAFPNVIGEAMLTGVPCIVTDIGDSKEIVNDYGNIIQPSDDDILFDAMCVYRNMSHDKLKKIGISARKHITQNYKIEQIEGKYHELYDK